MGVLARSAILCAVLGACYEPDIRDCKLACGSAADCAADQVCGADMMCASPAVAGTCNERLGADAGTDAPPPPIDAPAGTLVDIHIVISGAGKVAIGPMMCMSMSIGMGSDAGDCTLQAPLGTPAMAVAMGMGPDMFDRWTSITCGLQGPTCTFTPTLATTQIAVQFMNRP
jgi:hypothetical protein